MKSMEKNKMEKPWGQNWNLEIALGYETNANPEPPCTVIRMLSVPVSWARFPRTPNTITQDMIDVNVSRVVTILTSLMIFKFNYFFSNVYWFINLFMLWVNLLNEEYMIMVPRHIANEKNACVTAEYHT